MFVVLMIVSLVAAVLLLAWLVLKLHPAFGAQGRKEQYANQIPTTLAGDFKTSLSILRDFMKKSPNRKPARSLPLVPLAERFQDAGANVTWFGHSALLVEIDGKRLLVDPMFGRNPSPFPQIGGKRYSDRLPLEIAHWSEIDAVLLTHDHYDHLDYPTIRQLHHKVRRFITPLGVGAHLKRWGVAAEKITEHAWWEEVVFEGLTLACTPARHFSGRSLSDRNSTLWCSWVVQGQDVTIYCSGDSGYGPHFAEIGAKYGPFDLTLMECGQYEERWADIHMFPEETVQAHRDLRGRAMIPIHWAAFTLALHDWTDSVERVTRAAEEQGVTVYTPLIGETVRVGAESGPTTPWWREPALHAAKETSR